MPAPMSRAPRLTRRAIVAMADPERLGKYEIKGALGKGAMGVVYKGFDPHIERFVAIKTIRKDLVEPELAAQYMARFKNEAKAAGRLHHPNIVGVYEYGEDDAVTFIAMEYVEGTGLREYLNRRASFDFARLVALMAQLLIALEFAHERGVVHRDIKPSNLIVTNQGVLKVADFGIARVDTSNLTMAGMVIGTPSYMSPEQCRGLDVDARSDLFSAGVVLYELLTGEKPFRGNIEAIAYKICHEEPVPPSQLSKLKLPPAVDQLIATALAKEPGGALPERARVPRRAARRGANVGGSRRRGADDDGGIGTLMLQKPTPSWDEETLRTAERELARALGPMAKVMVRRAAAQTTDRTELCSILSDNITDPDMRRNFVAAFERTTGSGVRTGTSGAHGTTGAAYEAAPQGQGRRALQARPMQAPQAERARRSSRSSSTKSPRGSRSTSAPSPRSSRGRRCASRRTAPTSCGAWPTAWAPRSARRF